MDWSKEMSGDLLRAMMLRVESLITSVRIGGGASSSAVQPSQAVSGGAFFMVAPADASLTLGSPALRDQPSSSRTRVCFSYRPTALETAPRPRRASGRMVVFRTTVIGQDDTP